MTPKQRKKIRDEYALRAQAAETRDWREDLRQSRVYLKPDGKEHRLDLKWPDRQAIGINQQTPSRFNMGMNKEFLTKQLQLQTAAYVPYMIASDIMPSDRLLLQILDSDFNDSTPSPPHLFENANRKRQGPDSSGFKYVFNGLLCDEDILYDDFESLIKTTAQDRQFLILGDMNHSNAAIQRLRFDPELLPVFKRHGFKTICLEYTQALQPLADAYKSRSITRNEFIRQGLDITLSSIARRDDIQPRSYILKTITSQLSSLANYISDAKKHGISISFVDDLQDTYFENGKLECDIPQRLKHDRELAERIKIAASSAPAIIIYGGAHGMYNGTLDECLGLDNVTRVNLHPNQRHMRWSGQKNIYADYQPRYIYLIEEGKIVMAPDNYMRKADIDEDPIQRALDPEIKALHDRRIELHAIFEKLDLFKNIIAIHPFNYGLIVEETKPDDFIQRSLKKLEPCPT